MSGGAAWLLSSTLAAVLAGCGSAGQGAARPVAPLPAPAPEPPPPAAAPRPAPAAIVREPVAMDPSTTCGIRELRAQALEEVNRWRAAGAWCGARQMPPAPPLAWSDALFSAAARHSHDMAANDYFDHQDTQGRRVGLRALAQGYRWGAVAENIAGGDGSVALVMAGWKRSPLHCRAMLDSAYVDVGVACVDRPQSRWGTYWTMVLARPR